MATVSFSMKDHSREMLEQMTAQVEKALEMCGMTAENYAKHLCPVDQGRLRNSIAHTVEEESGAYTAMIGSAVEYAPYVELGTGQYYPGGRPTPWIYQDDKLAQNKRQSTAALHETSDCGSCFPIQRDN